MNSTNMLSANKVKLHGMTSELWTTKDKITQYKGLINLYTRDKKIIEMDVAIAKKRQLKELQTIQTDININRKKLENACGGDRQKLRNALAEDRIMQMAYGRSTPQEVIDNVMQVAFRKRKTRDMFRYKTKLKSNILIDLKLKCAIYEDRLKYEGADTMLPCEKQAHLITGRVQDAILKKEAAIYIRNSYKEMIAIMTKDSIYFDAILVSLKNDGIAQGKCMINATKLGQMGTEYLDDRRQEYQFLEKVVKTDLVARKKDLAYVQNSAESFQANLKNLIRRDSDINLGKIILEESKSTHMLQKEIFTIESTLKILKDAFFTQTFDQIFPCLKEQKRQKERLQQFVQKCELNRDDLMKKLERAAALYASLENTMAETTIAYTSQKLTLNADIKYEKEKAEEYEKLIKARYALLAKVRISLRHLQYLARLLAMGMKFISASTLAGSGRSARSSNILWPEEDECDATKIIPELKTKFEKLAEAIEPAKTALAGAPFESGYRTLELLMRDRCKPIEVDAKGSEGSFIESPATDAHVLSREDIKKISAEIVMEGLAALEYKPPPPPARKKYKFKK